MKINKNNYPAYFLDFHEGTLTPNEVAEVLLFVEQHPELKEELERFENVTLEDYATITFENKADLKKEITSSNKEEYFIRAVERTLNSIETTLLENYIKQHPQYLIDFNLYQKTKLLADTSIVFENKEALKKALTPAFSRGEGYAGEAPILVPDTSIVFKNKEALKRKERRIVPLYYYVSVAAAVLLLFGLFFLYNNNKGQQVATINKASAPAKNVLTVAATKTLASANESGNKVMPEVKSNGVVKKNVVKRKRIKENNVATNKTNKTIPELIIKKEEPTINSANSIVENKKEEPIALNVESGNKNEEPTTINSISEQQTPNSKLQTPNTNEYLSIKEIAVSKLKENTMDDKTIDAEKKTGRLNKLSGWDLAKVVANGVSKLTGKKVKVEPKYNDQGDVTAYALGAGSFEITRGK